VFGSVAISLLLTVLFAVTGGYALLRWASLRTGVAGRAGDGVAELSHLLMSLAMIVMAWGYGSPAATTAQIVLFGGLGGYFAIRLAASRLAASTRTCPASGFHLLMCAGMVWMVVAMPWLMASAGTAGSAADMPMDGMSMPMAPGAPVAGGPRWAGPITVVLAVAMLVASAYWVGKLARSVRPTPPAESAPVALVVPAASESRYHPAGPPSAVPVARGGSRPVEAPVSERLLAVLTPRADDTCHLLMSLGMAAMLLLMR
jgi:hypothetical protein